MKEVVINAFDQDGVVVSGGAITYELATVSRFNGEFYNGSGTNNDKIQFTRYFPKSGLYKARLIYNKNTNEAKTDIGLDSSTNNIFSQIDMYAASGTKNNVMETLIQIPRGYHTISFLANGKNASSSNYFFLIQALQFDLIAEYPNYQEMGTAPPIPVTLGPITIKSSGTLTNGITMSSANIALGANNITTTTYTLAESSVLGHASWFIKPTSASANAFMSLATSQATGGAAIFYFNRVSDVTTNYETMAIGSDVLVTGEFSIQSLKGGTGTIRPINVYMQTTKLLSFDTANTITFYQNLIASNGASYVSPSYLSQNSSWAIDASGSGFSITSSSTYQPFGASNNFAGFCILENASNGNMCYVAYSGGSCLVTNLNGTDFVNSSTPSTSQIGIYADGSNIFTVKNGFTTTKDIRIIAFRTNNAK